MKRLIRATGPDGHDIVKDIDLGPSRVGKVKTHTGGYRASGPPKVKPGIDFRDGPRK